MAVRTAEMEQLQKLYEKRENHLVMVYGRSGMEQYELLDEFLKDKKYVYYPASECSNEMQREYFAACVSHCCNTVFSQNDYATIFNRIRSGDASKLVLVVDHVEHIMKKDPVFFKEILNLKKKHYYPGPVMILFLTDSLVFAEQELRESRKEEFAGFDRIIKLSELKFLDVVRRFPNYSVSQSIEVYGVLGGVPGYLKYWDANKTLKENVCGLILERDGLLAKEAHDYLAAQLREYSVYQTILATIAGGREKLNDIYHYTGYSRAKISVYMKNLAAFEVIERVTSFETGGWENAKKGIYHISNTFLNFWFRFVFPNQGQLHSMGTEAFYEAFIEPGLEDYLNETFKKVCMEYLELSSSIRQLPISIAKMGTWIGKKGNIDIIAQDKVRNTIVGSCSWSEDCFTYEMYENLLERMKDAKVKSEYCYLFSAKSFEPRLLDAAKQDRHIVIVDMNEM